MTIGRIAWFLFRRGFHVDNADDGLEGLTDC